MHLYDNWKLLYEQYIYTQDNLNFLTYRYKQIYNGCRKKMKLLRLILCLKLSNEGILFVTYPSIY